ncbi:MAG: sigma-70 family RNA polymerase sigma factor [Clostridium sp.]|nr:sigma-70 family RNA polymerase sigma factor [Clostridium sp.]
MEDMGHLIKKAQKQDADAFTELIESHMQLMYKTARAVLYCDEDIADAIQETILTCWEKISQLRKVSGFRTWLTRILVNKCNDILRKKQMVSFYEDVPEVETAQNFEFENVEWNETLESLDEKYRLVIILYYVEGFKTKEISRILELPEATVRTRLARARAKVADLYQISLRSGQVL